jgi:hypothetical protein
MTEVLIFWTFGFLIIYLGTLSALGGEAAGTLSSVVELAGYLLLAAAISRTRWRPSQLSALWLLMAGGLFISSSLTIVDYAGIVDIPYNNDATRSTSAGGFSVWQASGFFARRSGMAAIFVLSITGSLVLALARESVKARLYFLAAASSGLLCLFLTHNRSGVLSAIAVVAVYTLVSPRFRGGRRIKILLGGAAASGIFLAIVILFFPEHVAVYRAKLGFIGLADTTWESDAYRYELFIAAIKSIGKNPLGNGFTMITLPGGIAYNPHNVVTAIIWAAGGFSFIWLPLFTAALYLSLGRRLANRPARPLPVESDALSCALLAWLLNGMTHNTIFTGLAWALFGLMLSIRYFSDLPQTGPETGPSTVQHPFG